MSLETIVFEAKEKAQKSIIWLHGLGADGNDFAPIIPMLNLSESTRVVLPHAPIMPITINGGMQMRAWYDISDMALRNKDAEGIEKSKTDIEELIQIELDKGIIAKNILLVGFSQGGAMSLYCGTNYKKPLAGVLAMSSYLLEENPPKAEDEKKQMPIYIMHGTRDPIVDYKLGSTAHKKLIEKNYQVKFSDYNMEHQLVPEQINDIKNWLKELDF